MDQQHSCCCHDASHRPYAVLEKIKEENKIGSSQGDNDILTSVRYTKKYNSTAESKVEYSTENDQEDINIVTKMSMLATAMVIETETVSI